MPIGGPRSGALGNVATIIESFEDGDVSEYALDTGSFTVQSTTVFNGANALESSFSTSENKNIISTDFSVGNGNTYRYNIRFPTTDVQLGIYFGIQDETSIDGYNVFARPSESDFILDEVSSGSFTTLGSDTNITYSTGVWYEIEFEWGASGGLTATLFDETDTQVAQATETDSTYTSGGIGWRMFNNSTNSRSGFFDYLREI